MEQLTAMYKLSLIQHMVIKNALRAPAFTESVVNVELFHFKTITVTGGVVPHVFFFLHHYWNNIYQAQNKCRADKNGMFFWTRNLRHVYKKTWTGNRFIFDWDHSQGLMFPSCTSSDPCPNGGGGEMCLLRENVFFPDCDSDSECLSG